MVIRVGAQIQPQHAEYRQMRDAWLRVEEARSDMLFTWERFYPLYGDPDGKHLQCWTMLAAMTEVAQRVKFGALVTRNSYRKPNLLADMARSVDPVSCGRMILGRGSGWFRKNYDKYGCEFGTARGRLRGLYAGMLVIEERMKRLKPPPTCRMPILIGGGGKKVTLRIVAEHARIWNGFGDPPEAARKIGILADWRRKVGRDSKEIECSILVRSDQLKDLDAYKNGVTYLIFGHRSRLQPLTSAGAHRSA